MQLALRTTVIIDPIENDYVVVDKELGIACGRIYRTNGVGGGYVWSWHVQEGRPVVSGLAPSLEAAKVLFQPAWESARSAITERELAEIRDQQERDSRRFRPGDPKVHYDD